MMYIRTVCLLVLSVAMIAVTPRVSQATMVIPTSLEEMTAQAELIFIGRCEKRETKARPFVFGGHVPVSTYTFTIDEVLKNTAGAAAHAGEVFVFSQPGGTLPTGKQPTLMRSKISAVTYTPGEHVMLFLVSSKHGANEWENVGLMQGKFTIATSPDGKTTVVNGNRNKYLFPRSTHGAGAKGAFSVSKAAQAVEKSPSGALPLNLMRDEVQINTAAEAGAK